MVLTRGRLIVSPGIIVFGFSSGERSAGYFLSKPGGYYCLPCAGYTISCLALLRSCLFSGICCGALTATAVIIDSWQGWGKVEQVVKRVVREGSDGTDNEFLVNLTFAGLHPVNLADRYPHRVRQLGEVTVFLFTKVKDPCSNNHDLRLN